MKMSKKRVVSTFLLQQQLDGLKLAVFHRCDTMPTFPSHWAVISGSVEDGETPAETAKRELLEETDWYPENSTAYEFQTPGGLYVDVQDIRAYGSRTIRVYPFMATVTPAATLRLKGTEHDCFRWVTLDEFATLTPTVPKLKEAFHHATFGSFLSTLPDEIKLWSTDFENGAAYLAHLAAKLALKYPTQAQWIPILRPSMVSIGNVVRQVMHCNNQDWDVDHSFKYEAQRCVTIGTEALERIIEQSSDKTAVIATFSRSSTVRRILLNLKQKYDHSITILCGKSVPGQEGILMAQDVQGVCIDDDDLYQRIANDNKVDAVIVGADCIKPSRFVVNKVGTKRLAELAKQANIPILCCSDRWKLWDDDFPPPLEPIFEVIDSTLFTSILIPDET